MQVSTHVLPFLGRALRAAGRASGAAFTAFGQFASSGLTLVPQYLSGLLWLLSQQFLDLAREGYGRNAAVYACLHLLSTSVPEPPLIAYQIDASGKTKRPLPYNHPLSRLIRQPNPLLTEFGFWELTTLHLGIVGRSVWWKERDNAGRVIALWPLRPDRVGPIYDAGGPDVLQGWSYLVPGTPHYIAVAAADTALFVLPDPAGESGGLIEGLGPLQVLAAEVGADNQATQFVGSMLDNYAMPGVVLSTKSQLKSTEDAKLIKEAFKRDFAGTRIGSPAVIDADTTVSQVGFNLQQLEFPQLRKVSESRIASAFRVPAILVGLQVGLESGIRATIAEQREFFAETTLSDYWRRYSDSYTKDIASEFGDDILAKFDTSAVRALVEHSQQEIDKIAQGFTAGAVSVNEYRQHVLNLPPRDDGDMLLIPQMVTPTDDLHADAEQADSHTQANAPDAPPDGESVHGSAGTSTSANAQINEGEPLDGTPHGQSVSPDEEGKNDA